MIGGVMSLYVTIAAAITIAVTAKLMYLIFLSGRTITNATLFGRLIARIDPARRAFVAGWRSQSWRYQCKVWPCMLLSMGLVSLLLKWMMPAMENAQTFSDKIRYCLLVFGIGMPTSITLSFLLIMLVYYAAASVVEAWWRPEAARREDMETAREVDGIQPGNEGAAQPDVNGSDAATVAEGERDG